MRILHVVGTRPNYVKTAPVIAAARERLPGSSQVIVHTGQHYDRLMSEVFFDELGVPEPGRATRLGDGAGRRQLDPRRGPHRDQDGHPRRPHRVRPAQLRPGDAGGVNRIVADEFSEYLFLHSEEAITNLRAEGIADERMHFVGNTMIDTLVALEERILAAGTAARLGLEPGSYTLVTLHRPALVDGPLLPETVAQLGALAEQMPVIFPIHPRTRKMMEAAGAEHPGLNLSEPLGYLDFLSLVADAGAVLTDSGGIQEETTYLGVPCFTLRDNTERPVTVRAGTNTMLGLDPAAIAGVPAALVARSGDKPEPPPLWDGHAAERVADVLAAAA